jgi:hypothetical protein
MNMAIRDANRIEAGTIEQLLASEISDVFLITGIDVSEDRISSFSLDDYVSSPPSHGLFTAIDAIVQSHYRFICHRMSLGLFNNKMISCDNLKIVFKSTIREGFTFMNGINPACWLHLGHGGIDKRLATHQDEWEDEWYDEIAIISNGSEQKDFIDAKEITSWISKNKGHIFFLGLPLCHSKNIGDVFEEANKIAFLYAVFDKDVNQMNEFYSAEQFFESKPRLGWNDWFYAIESSIQDHLYTWLKRNQVVTD